MHEAALKWNRKKTLSGALWCQSCELLGAFPLCMVLSTRERRSQIHDESSCFRFRFGLDLFFDMQTQIMLLEIEQSNGIASSPECGWNDHFDALLSD
jgi:hypothetical protein